MKGENMNEKEICEKLKRFDEDSRWIDRHYDELKARYPHEFVAVLNGNVVDHRKDIKKLTKRLDEKYPNDANDIAVEYITPEKVVMIL